LTENHHAICKIHYKGDDLMTTADIIEGIVAKKAEIQMTSQQLSDASGVPKSTVDRILRGDTPNPSMQTILDLAAAVGYSFGNHPQPEPAVHHAAGIKDPMVLQIISIYESRGKSYEERIKRNTAHFNMLLSEKNRWIKLSLTLNIILVIFICAVLLYDATHPDVGWIRDQLESFQSSGIRDAFWQLRDFCSGLFIQNFCSIK